jgi:uncharacterized iron-regulated membrane protein
MGWRSFRNGLQSIHLWVGLILSIPFILIGLSGSIIVFIQAMPDMTMPKAATAGQSQPLVKVIEAAEAAAPQEGAVNALVLPNGAGDPVQVQFGPPPGTRPANVNLNTGKTLFLDPVSLKVLGDMERRRAGAFMRTVTTLHIALMFPGHFGLQFVGLMGVFLVLFGVSGLILWWPKKGQWRPAFGVKKGARGFRLHRDLHGAVGIWSLFVFLVISLSGVDLAFPVTFQDMVGTLLPLDSTVTEAKIDPAVAASIANPNTLTADDAVKLALAAVPDARVASIQLPPPEGGVYMVALNANPYGNGQPQISAFIGPGAEVSSIVDPRTYAIGKRFLVWLRVLHYGQGWGDPWRILVFFSGFLPLLFAITGLRMWQLKRSNRRPLPDALPAPAE